MKTYVLMVSRFFPAYHPKAGKPTGFTNKILACYWNSDNPESWKKRHTIRTNYDLWAKRIAEVQAGEAVLSIRYWTGKPYRSEQQELVYLEKNDYIGIQKLQITPIQNKHFITYACMIDDHAYSVSDIAHNDGLSVEDWCAWFQQADFTKPFAVIHFTPARYEPTA